MINPLLSKIKIVFIVFTTLILFACQKSFDSGPGVTVNPIESKPDLDKKVTVNLISGFVTDENDGAANSVSIEAGGIKTTTDKYGYFEIRKAQVVENAATVVILKNGYFKSIKTFIATAGKNAFFRIKLLPKIKIGNISSLTGGSVTLANGSLISLPANAVINTTTNTSYTGTINVAAQLISASDPDLNRKMPGDLRGINSENNIRLLTTFGMMAVELTGSNGESLQIASGKKATINITIPSELQASAPSSIPLWYFNENTGLWIEEGSAAKNGTTYSGEVSHFSYWNYDEPNQFVKFNCTIVDQNGKPIQNALVKISTPGKFGTTGFGYTDSAGYTGGAVPNNQQLLLQVFSNDGCSNALYSKSFTTNNTTIALGTLTFTSQSLQATVSGTVSNCTNGPVNTGYIIMSLGSFNYRYPVKNGAFTFTTVLCSTTTNVSIIAEDPINSQQNTAVNYTLNTGNNSIGNIKSCGVTTTQFIDYIINGNIYHYSPPADTLYYYNAQPNINLGGTKLSPPFSGVSILFTNSGIAAGSNQNLVMFDPTEISDTMSIANPIMVNITEYGTIGQFIAGNFTGTFRGNAPANTQYNVTFNFRVKRYF